MTAHQIPASRPHDEAIVDILKADPELADVHLAAALGEATLPGGQFALLAARRQIDKLAKT